MSGSLFIRDPRTRTEIAQDITFTIVYEIDTDEDGYFGFCCPLCLKSRLTEHDKGFFECRWCGEEYRRVGGLMTVDPSTMRPTVKVKLIP